MNDSGKPCCNNPKPILWTVLIFALFGFLALILSGRLGSKSPENRAFEGEFSAETTKQRWANLAEVSEAQTALVDEAKVDAALAALVQSPGKPAATEIVVPGSPTFLKQMEQQAAPATEAPKPEAPAPAPATPAPAPAPTTPAPAPAPAAPAPTTPAPAPAPTAPAPTTPAPAPAPAAPAPAPAAPAAPAPAPAQ